MREEWLTAHMEIPTTMIAAVIAAVFQFTNALHFTLLATGYLSQPKMIMKII